MKLLQQRLLRGANRYAPVPCLMALVDLEDACRLDTGQLAAMHERLCVVLPGLRDLGCPISPHAGAGELLALCWDTLHHAAGEARGLVCSEAVADSTGQRRIVLAYDIEHVAQGSLSLALAIMEAVLREQPFALGPHLAALRERARGYRLPEAARRVRDEALAAGIPVMRVSEHASLLQLGWGSRQWRFLDGAAGGALLGGAIARDRQLVRALLEEACLPVSPGAMAECTLDEAPVTVEVRGGRAVGETPASLVPLAERAAAKIGLVDAAVEIALGDGSTSAMVAGIHARGHEQAAPDGHADGDGRIPVIAVTGTNGKTTTTLMIAHAARMAGLRTGCTTTQGIFQDEVVVARGDCTGYWSHRAVLSSPDTDIAVLEAARGGLLKRGLAFDRCKVGVMLNVSSDHLGLDGIDTVEELARVKSLVVQAADGSAVLNADDPNCVALASRLRPGTETIYFSMDAANPVVAAHLSGGGRALVLADEQLVLRRANEAQALMAAGAIPCTLGGRARFNIANSLAAAAALLGAGLNPAQIVDGLASFVSDAHGNPLRLNLFDVRGIQVIVDYAHNPAAYAALGAVARSLAPRRLVGVITSPGDRRDADLQGIGASCASHFDALVVYESASRGRPRGEAASLIRKGAQAVATERQHIEQIDEVLEAVRRGLQLCDPGDVLAFACGSSLHTLVEALRPMDALAAEQLAAQIA